MYQCTNEYSNIFEYFPPNIDTRAYGAIAPKSLGCASHSLLKVPFLCKGDYEQTDGHFELYI